MSLTIALVVVGVFLGVVVLGLLLLLLRWARALAAIEELRDLTEDLKSYGERLMHHELRERH